MSLVKNYISTLRTNKLALENEESKRTFFKYCIETSTANFFLGRDCEHFKSAMDDNDFRESILFAQKKSLQHQSSLKSF